MLCMPLSHTSKNKQCVFYSAQFISSNSKEKKSQKHIFAGGENLYIFDYKSKLWVYKYI